MKRLSGLRSWHRADGSWAEGRQHLEMGNPRTLRCLSDEWSGVSPLGTLSAPFGLFRRRGRVSGYEGERKKGKELKERVKLKVVMQ